jgi:hypothetical protein
MKPTKSKTPTKGLFSPSLIQSIMDEDDARYKTEINIWWKSLTKEEQIKEWQDDDQLLFYVDNPFPPFPVPNAHYETLKQHVENKKVVKIVKHFEDGTSEYIDGEALDNYQTNMDVANGICLSRSYITFKPVDWKVTEGNTTLDDFKHSTED